MIEQCISDIESKIRAEPMSDAKREELLQLVTTLKTELAALDQASRASREKKQVLRNSVNELRSSVEGFEQSHPKIVQAINSISSTLSNWGV